MSRLADLDRLYATVKQQKGRVDILFANAGVLDNAPLGSITEESFDRVFNINVKGLLFTVQKALPLMPDGGSIILTASVVASRGYESMSVYSATKAAVRSFGVLEPRRPQSSKNSRQRHQPRSDRNAHRSADTGANGESDRCRHTAGPIWQARRDRASRGVPRIGRQQLYCGSGTVCRRRRGASLVRGHHSQEREDTMIAGMSPLGIFHTAVSVLAVGFGLYALRATTRSIRRIRSVNCMWLPC